MSNIESKTESGTHDKFKTKVTFDSIVAHDHFCSEFFSCLLSRFLLAPQRMDSENG